MSQHKPIIHARGNNFRRFTKRFLQNQTVVSKTEGKVWHSQNLFSDSQTQAVFLDIALAIVKARHVAGCGPEHGGGWGNVGGHVARPSAGAGDSSAVAVAWPLRSTEYGGGEIGR